MGKVEFSLKCREPSLRGEALGATILAYLYGQHLMFTDKSRFTFTAIARTLTYKEAWLYIVLDSLLCRS